MICTPRLQTLVMMRTLLQPATATSPGTSFTLRTLRAGCAEIFEKRTDDAVRALVRHVGKQADEAESAQARFGQVGGHHLGGRHREDRALGCRGVSGVAQISNISSPARNARTLASSISQCLAMANARANCFHF